MLQKGDEPVPGYRLEEFLGRGAFGEVWRATSPGRARVALKFLNMAERQGVKEFRAIQRLKSVRHPHLASTTALWLLDENGNVLGDDILDSYAIVDPPPRDTLLPAREDPAVHAPKRLVVATLLCDKNLADRLQECQQQKMTGIPVEELLRYMEEAAKGIDFLNSPSHDLGEGPVAIQHCDIKPANIMLTGDCVMICDFGLARFVSDPKVAATGTSMAGSPAYMAPECIKSKPTSTSDQYSLAVTYAELRTGRLPFYSESWMDVLEAHCKGNLDLSGLTPREREVIHKATSVSPDDRYPSTVAMVRALRLAAETQDGESGRFPRRLALASVVVLLTALIAWGVIQFVPKKPPKQEDKPITGVAPGLETITFQVVPADAEVLVDGTRVTADASGHVTLERSSDAQLDIRVTKRPEYRDIQQKYSAKQLSGRSTVISLERDIEQLRRLAQEDANRAFAVVDADEAQLPQLATAVKAYQRAIQSDESRYATIPPAVRSLNEPEKEYNFTVRCMALHPKQPWLAARVQGNKICLWDLRDLNRAKTTIHEHSDHVCNVVMAGNYIASADIADHVKLTALDDNGAARETIEPASLGGTEIAISPDLHWLVAGGFDGTVRAWPLGAEAKDAAVKTLGQHSVSVRGIVITPDSRWAITSGEDGAVRKWDLTSSQANETTATIELKAGDVSAMCVAPDSQLVAVGSGAEANAEFSIALIRLPQAAVQRLPQGHPAEIYAAAFDPFARSSRGDFPLLASGSAAGDIQVRHSGDGPPLLLSGRHAGAVRSLAFSHADGWLVSGSEDGTVGLWNLKAAQQKPMLLPSRTGRVVQVAVTPKFIIAATSNGTILMWDLPRCILVKQACDELGIEPQAAEGGRKVIDT